MRKMLLDKFFVTVFVGINHHFVAFLSNVVGHDGELLYGIGGVIYKVIIPFFHVDYEWQVEIFAIYRLYEVFGLKATIFFHAEKVVCTHF